MTAKQPKAYEGKEKHISISHVKQIDSTDYFNERTDNAPEDTNYYAARHLIRKAYENSPKMRLRRSRTALIGPKADHYIPIFEHLDRNGGQSWNWCGFLFAPYWFAYRKLYAWSGIAIAAPKIASCLYILLMSAFAGSDVGMTSVAVRFIELGCAVAFALLANKVYKTQIDKLAAEIPEADAEKEQYAKSKGGVSIPAVVIAILIYAVLTTGMFVLLS